MIPYFSLTTLTLGPFTLHAWGFFVALGFIVGSAMACWLAKRRGSDPGVIMDVTMWLALAGMVGGRIGHVLFYDPAYYWGNPIEVFEIWKGGLSVYGGMILAAIVGVLYLRRRHVDVFQYADVIAFGLPLGMWAGRIGCFLIHDHPGTATDFILGVQYPDGVVRHDLGLYESINALVLAMVMLWLSRKERPVGTYLATFSIWYGATRFFLDFLRVIDVRYFGLTPGQYFSVGFFVFGIGLLMWIRKRSKKG